MIGHDAYSYTYAMMLSGFKRYRAIAVVLSACLLTLANCKRSEEPFNDKKEPPVFSIKGTVSGQPVQMVAGVDSYYLYTSYAFDSSVDAFSFSGNLKRTNCTTCNQSIKITIYDSVPNSGTDPVNIGLALRAKNYQYHGPQQVVSKTYKYNFVAEVQGYVNPSYKWTFGPGDSSNSAVPTHTFTDTLGKNICLTVTDQFNGCTDAACNNVTPARVMTDTATPDFSAMVVADTAYFSASNAGPNVIYSWNFGDTRTGTGLQQQNSYASPGVYNVCLTVTSTVGAFQPRVICKKVAFMDTSKKCMVNYSYGDLVVDSAVTGVSKLSKVIINYTDDAGEEYVSDFQNQPPTSFFTVVAAQPYTVNERGEKTYRLTLNFRCRVFSTSTPKFHDIDITNGEIAVAYP